MHSDCISALTRFSREVPCSFAYALTVLGDRAAVTSRALRGLSQGVVSEKSAPCKASCQARLDGLVTELLLDTFLSSRAASHQRMFQRSQAAA